jgi:hypothetical protein
LYIVADFPNADMPVLLTQEHARFVDLGAHVGARTSNACRMVSGKPINSKAVSTPLPEVNCRIVFTGSPAEASTGIAPNSCASLSFDAFKSTPNTWLAPSAPASEKTQRGQVNVHALMQNAHDLTETTPAALY